MLMILIFSSFSNNVQIDKWNASKLNINKTCQMLDVFLVKQRLRKLETLIMINISRITILMLYDKLI